MEPELERRGSARRQQGRGRLPALLEIPPGKEKKIRIGVKTTPGQVEKTYRVFVEELPGLQTPGAKTEVRVLTKFGVPVFLAPTTIKRDSRIGGLVIAKGRLGFAVENTGTVNAIVKSVKITGIGAAQEQLYSHQEAGWYVLGGTSREYQLELPPERCDQTTRVSVEVVTDQSKPSAAEIAIPAGGCRR